MNTQIAAEAWDEIRRTYAITDVTGRKNAKDGPTIIKSAIEKAREAEIKTFLPMVKQEIEKSREAHANEPYLPKSSFEKVADELWCREISRLNEDSFKARVAGILQQQSLAAHASERNILPHDWNKDLPVITHLTPPAPATDDTKRE